MNSYKVNSRILSRFTQVQSYCSALSNKESKFRRLDYMNMDILNENKEKKEIVKYPPILDKSIEGVFQRGRESWYNKVKRLGVVEEKIFELNMPRYYGWKACKINECVFPYDPLPQAQYITRTAVDDTKTLPEFYDKIINEEKLNFYVQQIKDQVKNAIIFEYGHSNWKQEDDSLCENKGLTINTRSKALCQQINRIIISNLTQEYPHLLETQTDIEPRIEAFWFFGGLERPLEYKRGKFKGKTTRINEPIKYRGTPLLTLRHNLPLKEIISLKDAENISFEIPVEILDLRKMGYVKARERATVIPGFWPGDHSEFGILSYHKLGYLEHRRKEFDDNLDAVTAQAVFGSYSWLYAQACYKGFSTFQDPTYPLINQMILTNGKLWYFSVYQLNTTAMHLDCIDTNNKKNVCWLTKPIELFHCINNGSVEGFNEDVLKYLIKFYANIPEVRKVVSMQPYLRKEKLIANIEDDERRAWLEQHYKHLMSNRPRHLLTPEIYQYQDIFVHKLKIMRNSHKRFDWQLKINPYSRRLNEHTPKYIPKCKRIHKKVKFAKTFYPSVRKPKPTLKVKSYKRLL